MDVADGKNDGGDHAREVTPEKQKARRVSPGLEQNWKS
jgi:hypothetical protein